MKDKILSILFSLDTYAAIIMSGIVGYCLPDMIRADFSLTFYSVGISVLSIIFSLFFTALAIIMSASDNDFISFLEEKGHYTFLMFTFKVTLFVLFVSLVYSIIIDVYTDFFIKHHNVDYKVSKWPFVIFVFIFTYSLASSVISVKDTIMFSRYRIRFLNKKKEDEKSTEI